MDEIKFEYENILMSWSQSYVLCDTVVDLMDAGVPRPSLSAPRPPPGSLPRKSISIKIGLDRTNSIHEPIKDNISFPHVWQLWDWRQVKLKWWPN